MAQQSSREAALARRMALSNGGKTAEKRYSTSAGRVRSAVEARPSRTAVVASAPVTVEPTVFRQQSLVAPSHNLNRGRIANPSRDLALAHGRRRVFML